MYDLIYFRVHGLAPVKIVILMPKHSQFKFTWGLFQKLYNVGKFVHFVFQASIKNLRVTVLCANQIETLTSPPRAYPREFGF